jgi:hypothetical protein
MVLQRPTPGIPYKRGVGWEHSVKGIWYLRVRPRIDGGPGVMIDTYSYGTGIWSAPLAPDEFPGLIAALYREAGIPQPQAPAAPGWLRRAIARLRG